MKINGHFPTVYPICINIKERKSKKKWMTEQAKQQHMKIHFHKRQKR